MFDNLPFPVNFLASIGYFVWNVIPYPFNWAILLLADIYIAIDLAKMIKGRKG